MSAKPRLGFLGVGWIGRHRMEKIALSGMAEVAMLSDPSPEMLAEALKTAPGARIASDYGEMLESPDLDGIVIATPSALHTEQSVRALEAGKAVFCQKPLGRTSEEVAQVVDAARRAHRLLGVDFSYRYTQAMQRIRNLLVESAIGDVYAIDLVFHNAYGPDKPWFYDPALSGGGCVMDLGVHLVDLALWATGFPEVEGVSSRLYAGGKSLGSERRCVEDYALARLDLATGTSVQLACSWKLSAGCDCVITAEFHGTRGGLALRNVNGSFYDFVAELYRGTSRETLTLPPDDWGGRAGVDWAKRLGSGTRFDAADAEELVRVAEALDWIYGR